MFFREVLISTFIIVSVGQPTAEGYWKWVLRSTVAAPPVQAIRSVSAGTRPITEADPCPCRQQSQDSVVIAAIFPSHSAEPEQTPCTCEQDPPATTVVDTSTIPSPPSQAPPETECPTPCNCCEQPPAPIETTTEPPPTTAEAPPAQEPCNPCCCCQQPPAPVVTTTEPATTTEPPPAQEPECNPCCCCQQPPAPVETTTLPPPPPTTSALEPPRSTCCPCCTCCSCCSCCCCQQQRNPTYAVAAPAVQGPSDNVLESSDAEPMVASPVAPPVAPPVVPPVKRSVKRWRGRYMYW